IAIGIAIFVHLFLNVVIFVNDSMQSTGPLVASQIFYLSMMDLMSHCHITPGRWTSVPTWGTVVLETVMALLISELVLRYVWFTFELVVEGIIYYIISAIGGNEQMSSTVVDIVIILMAVFVMLLVVVATNQ
ncbi:hypothetical protein KR018_003626, partial [Drosophila ironensis]